MVSPHLDSSIETHHPPNQEDGRVVKYDEVEAASWALMEACKFDLDRDGMKETPARFARLLTEFFSPHESPVDEAKAHLKAFSSNHNNGLVRVSFSFSAFCAHHMLPFFGTAQVVYMPCTKITGLSKFSRAMRVLCSRPQVQEQITSEMAEAVSLFGPYGVLVDLTAEHTCMMIRGITDPCSSTRTQEIRGSFETNKALLKRALSMLE